MAATWNDPGNPGILTGKLLEALLLNKPVICCVAGTVSGSEANRLITRARVGYCWEQAGGEASDAGLKAYVQGLCQAFLAGEPLPFAPNPEAVQSYAYPRIAGRFEALMGPGEAKERSRL